MSSLTLRRHTRGLGISPRRSRPVSAGPPPSDTEAPTVPQNLSATAVSSSQIDLAWDASTDNVAVAGYRIYRDNVLVHTSATTAHSDTGLDPATEYQYEVSAIDAVSNESARSAPDSATTQSAGDTEAPSVPQNLSATAVSSSQIDLAWDASTDNVAVTGYNIYRDNVLVDTSATNSHADTGLAPGTEYEYEVSAFDAASNESARSAPDSATTPQAIVSAGLVAEWRFDAGAGQVLVDHTGNGHQGRLGSTTGVDAADPTWTAQGLSFDGGDFVEHDTVGITGGAARTVLAVVKTAATFGLEWPGTGPLFTRWTLRELSGKVRLEVAGAGHTTGFAIPLNSWFFVGATQATSNFNSCIVYFNGSAAAVPASATLNTGGNFSWARIVGTTVAMQAAYGLVYNRALSPAEVEQNRQALTAILAGRGITLP
jgi:chitodextrinase